METTLSTATSTVSIGEDNPTRLIGERINPTGRKKLTAALVAGDLEMIKQETLAQIDAGADILDINVGAAGVDEVALLPQVIKLVLETVDVPLSIDTANPIALRAGLAAYPGKALINSVNGEEKSLNNVLPLAAEFGARVIALTMDDGGIPMDDPAKRLAIARKIVDRAASLGIPRENILVDCLAMAVATDSRAGQVTLRAIQMVREELGVNLTLGASNVSFGLPDRESINRAWLPMLIAAGVNCPIVNVAKVRDVILAADLLVGRDEYAAKYIRYYRKQQAVAEKQGLAQG